MGLNQVSFTHSATPISTQPKPSFLQGPTSPASSPTPSHISGCPWVLPQFQGSCLHPLARCQGIQSPSQHPGLLGALGTEHHCQTPEEGGEPVSLETWQGCPGLGQLFGVTSMVDNLGALSLGEFLQLSFSLAVRSAL